MALPPGVPQADFDDAVRAWTASVGEDWVFTRDEDVALYRDAFSPLWGEPDEKTASAAVSPATVEEVQAVVRIANERRIPLYTISTGRNLAYGGAAPVYSGSVVLDLKRMNRILEVDERNAFALVEPGVSYFDLYRHIQQRGLKLWIDPPDPGWGSLIGNALDGGGGWTAHPFRDHFGAHCGMEVVLADGDLVRTGMGALPDSGCWQHYKWGFGPHVDGLFRQSNFGVVTKMGFWLMPEPEAYIAGDAAVYAEEDVIPLIDTLNLLENQGIAKGCTYLTDMSIFGPIADGAPQWTCTVSMYGPEPVIRAQLDYAKAKFAEIPRSTFAEKDIIRFPLTPEQQAHISATEWAFSPQRLVAFGVPNLAAFAGFGRTPANPNPDGSGHMGFSPLIPRTGEAAIEFRRFIREQLSEVAGDEDLGFSGPFYTTSWERTLVPLIGIPVTRNRETNAKARAAFRRLVTLAAERGWGEYRTAAAFMDDVADVYSFNDHAMRRLHERLKDAMDPNGILSAGRYGVWPKHLRDT